ncbi:MAG: hypothetical protein J6A25_00550 [Lachnospiraceae bacterium]|nr:hypothetical protein [Lachnospiraceae bacterium]
MASKKFDPALRTFETRVTFIRDIFENVFEPEVIMTSCIEYKLGRSFKNYLYEVTSSSWSLYGEDPMKVLRRIDK